MASIWARASAPPAEAPVHDNAKQLLLQNDERGTNLIFRKLHNTARVGKNSVSDKVVELLSAPDAKFEGRGSSGTWR